VPYWVPANVQSQYMQMARYGASRAVRAAPPETLPYQTQVFILETAMALQAQALHDSKYGPGKFDPSDPNEAVNPAYAPYNLAGWLERCLAKKGLQPGDDMRRPYAKFMGINVTNNTFMVTFCRLSRCYLPMSPKHLASDSREGECAFHNALIGMWSYNPMR
jgi:hypothetical protein